MVLLSTELQTFILFSPLKKKETNKKKLAFFCLCVQFNFIPHSDLCNHHYQDTDLSPLFQPIPVPVETVQLLSCVQLFATPWTAARQASLSFTISWSLFKLMSIESVMPPNYLIPLFLLSSIFVSIRISSNELALCIRWTKCWSFSFSISPSNILG